ncbi:hypothetical protein K1719_024941 [Acacia pycnantha]|nr:hypothetical protein K1719_024941 [Acacia pycnantha]
MSSVIGVSSVYQTPSLELKRATTSIGATTSLSFQFSDNKSHFNNVLRAHLSNSGCGNFKSGTKPRASFVPSSIATPNSSVLSEEAFKGLGGGFSDKDSLDDVTENDDYGYDFETEASSAVDSGEELDISKLGLPSRLVESLQQRGITHLFPIQVSFFTSPLILYRSLFFLA